MSSNSGETAPPTAPAPTATYTASCQCSAFAYTVTPSSPLNDASDTVVECNCSICTRNGYLFIYVPNERVVFTKGSIEEFHSYSFASKKVAHYFCGTCGSSCMLRSKVDDFLPGITAVNVRMLQDVDVMALKKKFVDGKRF